MVGARLGSDGAELVDRTRRLLAALHPMQLLPLAQLAFPALRRRPQEFIGRFVATLDELVHADGAVSLREYCLTRLVAIHLGEAVDPGRARVLGSLKLAECRPEVVGLLATLAAAGHPDPAAAARAFAAGVGLLFGSAAIAYAPPADWRAALDAAWPKLDRLNGESKQLLVEGLTRTIAHDGRVTVAESELLRTLCAALHCPLPPMLAR
jgi:hypothetical protein